MWKKQKVFCLCHAAQMSKTCSKSREQPLPAGFGKWQVFWLLLPNPPSRKSKNAVAFSGLGNDGVTAAGTANDFHVLPS